MVFIPAFSFHYTRTTPYLILSLNLPCTRHTLQSHQHYKIHTMAVTQDIDPDLFRYHSPARTFPHFSLLPAELRIIIWQKEAVTPRLIQLAKGHSISPLLHTCAESRYEFEQTRGTEGKELFFSSDANTGDAEPDSQWPSCVISFNPVLDVVDFTPDGMRNASLPLRCWRGLRQSWGQLLMRRKLETLVSLVKENYNSQIAEESLSFLLKHTRTILLDVVALALCRDKIVNYEADRLRCRQDTWRAIEVRYWCSNFKFIVESMLRVEDVILRFCELEEFGEGTENKDWTPVATVDDSMKVVYEWDPKLNGYKEVSDGAAKPSLAQSKTMRRVLGCTRAYSTRRLINPNLPMPPRPRLSFLL